MSEEVFDDPLGASRADDDDAADDVDDPLRQQSGGAVPFLAPPPGPGNSNYAAQQNSGVQGNAGMPILTPPPLPPHLTGQSKQQPMPGTIASGGSGGSLGNSTLKPPPGPGQAQTQIPHSQSVNRVAHASIGSAAMHSAAPYEPMESDSPTRMQGPDALVHAFFEGSPPPPKPIAAGQPPTLQVLVDMAIKGAWQGVIQLSQEFINSRSSRSSGSSGICSPRSMAHVRSLRLAAMLRLGMPAVQTEVSQIGDLSGTEYRAETHYEGQVGSIASFELRLLHSVAQSTAPSRTGAFNPLEPLYLLLDECQMCQDADEQLHGADKAAVSALLLDSTDSHESISEGRAWQIRARAVLLSIIRCHVIRKEFTVAVSMVMQYLNNNPDDLHVWWLACRLNMQIGDLQQAELLISKASALPGPAHWSEMHRGLLHICNNEIEDAVKCLTNAWRVEPTDPTILGNLAVALLYNRQAEKAISILEDAIKQSPREFLTQTIVGHLGSMYDLVSSEALARKATMFAVATRYAKDDVDLSPLQP